MTADECYWAALARSCRIIRVYTGAARFKCTYRVKYCFALVLRFALRALYGH